MPIVLTDREAFIVHLLAGVWDEYLKLPAEHPMDRAEFCHAIHAVQDMVLARPGRRAINAQKEG
ncbi:hypothetical protein [Pseudomonas mediterranea]